MNSKKVFWISIIALLLYLAIISLAGFISLWLYQQGYSSLWQLPMSIVPAIVICVWLNRLYRKHNFLPMYVFPPSRHADKREYKQLLTGIALSIITVVLAGLLMQLIFYPLSGDSGVMIITFLFGTPITSIIYMLNPAITEELLMRSGLLHAFWGIGRKISGIIISSTLFGLLHIPSLLMDKEPLNTENIIWILNVMIIGVFFAFLYLRFGVLCAIFFHWLWNASFATHMRLMEKNILPIIILVVVMSTYELYYRYANRKKFTDPVPETGLT